MKERAMSAYHTAANAKASTHANGTDTPTATTTAHPDISRLRVSEVPILIVANKNDLFRNKHSAADRRTLLQTLRFAAHYHGASLLITSCTDNSNKEAFRGFMNSFCFGVSMKPVLDVASDRAMIVTAGKDLFANILTGKSTGKGGEDENTNVKSVFASSEADVNSFLTASGVNKEAWVRFETSLMSVFAAHSPAAASGLSSGSGSGNSNAGNDDGTGAGPGAGSKNEYPEADIDEARRARDMVLDQYIADAARRERFVANPGSTNMGGNDDNGNNEEEEPSSTTSRDRGDRDRDRGAYGSGENAREKSDASEVDDRRRSRK